MMSPQQIARITLAAAAMALTSCAEASEEPLAAPDDVDVRQGPTSPFENTNIRIMSMSAGCDDTNDSIDTERVYDMPIEDQMARLASLAEEQSPDVITVHNAHMPECRDALVNELGGLYNYATNIKDNHQNTGLMIFSRDPFAKLHGTTGFGQLKEVEGYVNGVPFDKLDKFVAVMGSKSPNSGIKSIALARIAPLNGDPYFVLFADTAHASDFSFATSAQSLLRSNATLQQVNELPVFASAALKSDGMESNDPESLWSKIMDPAVASSATPILQCGLNGVEDGSECEHDFENALFTELWGYLQPLTDAGQSHDSPGQVSFTDVEKLPEEGGERRHFLFSNQPSHDGHYMCMQRIKRVFFADPNPNVQDYSPWTYVSNRTGETVPFTDDTRVSDSFPLVADFLLTRTDRCTPRAQDEINSSIGSEVIKMPFAGVETRALSLGDAQNSNRLHNAWFKLDEEGTISIGTDNLSPYDDLDAEVYHHSDLSTPISAWHGLNTTWVWGGESFTGPTYDFNDPPYYIRVAPSSTSGLPADGWLSIHKHTCTNPTNDYCLVSNNDAPTQVVWPDGQHVQPFPNGTAPPPAHTDSMYFVSTVGNPGDGTHHKAVFTLESDNTENFRSGEDRIAKSYEHCSYMANLTDCGSGPTQCNEFHDGEVSEWDELEGGTWQTTLDTLNHDEGALAPPSPGTVNPILMRVQRSCDPSECQESHMNVRFDANFYRLTPIRLICVDENDDNLGGDDEIYAQVGTDSDVLLTDANCVAGEFAPTTPTGYTPLGGFDEDGESNKQFLDLTSSIGGPWNFGSQTFTERAFVSLCEDDGGSNPSDHDFLGSHVHDFDNYPFPEDTTERAYTRYLITDDSDYRFAYNVKSEDPSVPPVCTP